MGRGQQVDRAIYGIRLAKADEREPRFLTWEEAEEFQSWMPEYVRRPRRHPHDAASRRDSRPPRPGRRLRNRLDRGVHSAAGRQGDHDKDSSQPPYDRVGPQTLKLLREQQLGRPATRDGYLFPAPSGAPFDGDNFFARVFKPAACHAGMPELTFHDLRHTGASLMIAAGCHVKVIAERMGGFGSG